MVLCEFFVPGEAIRPSAHGTTTRRFPTMLQSTREETIAIFLDTALLYDSYTHVEIHRVGTGRYR